MASDRRLAKRPRVLINCAASIDGKIANVDGSRARLSNEEDLRRVHRMRNSVDAILVGIGTILADDPSLSVKEKYVKIGRRSPTKIVLDSSCRTPARARVLSSPGQTYIATTENCSRGLSGARMIRCGKKRVDLRRVLAQLAQKGIRSMMVEGGGTVIQSFLRERLWDEMTVYFAPVLIGGSATPTIADGEGVLGVNGLATARISSSKRLGEGLLVRLEPARPRRSPEQ